MNLYMAAMLLLSIEIKYQDDNRTEVFYYKECLK